MKWKNSTTYVYNKFVVHKPWGFEISQQSKEIIVNKLPGQDIILEFIK